VALPTGPTAHEAPLFPALLAGLYGIFGDRGTGVLAVEVLQALVLTVQTMMMPLLAISLGIGFDVGCIAAFLLILGSGQEPYWEQNYVGLLLVVASLLAFRLLQALETPFQKNNTANQGRGIWHSRSLMWPASALGVMWGTILLTSPSPGLVWLSWVVLIGWKARRSAQQVWVPIALIPLVMLVPWTWRNYRVFHGPVLIRSNLGIELDVSNNPCASYAMRENMISGCSHSRHPFQNPEEAEKVVQLGESKYNRAKLKHALSWIVANPRHFVHLTLQRFVYFWFPTDSGGSFYDALFGFNEDKGPIQSWVVYPATLLSIPGLVLLWRRTRSAALVCGSILFFYPLVYYVVQFDYRYRLPILWVTFFLGAIAARRAVSLVKSFGKAPTAYREELARQFGLR